MSEQVIRKRTIVADGKDTELTPLYTWISTNIDIIYKLVFFTAALFALPILTFFLTLHPLFDGNTTYAGGAAAIAANVVVLLYIITAYFEKPKEDKSKTE